MTNNTVGNSSLLREDFTLRYSYPVHFTRRAWHPDNPTLADCVAAIRAVSLPVPCLVFLDAGLVEANPDLPKRFEVYFSRHAASCRLLGRPLPIDGGEAGKDGLDRTLEVVREGVAAGLCRRSAIVAVGGGAFLDAVGLGAALLHRGIPLIRMPTTVLSQNDSGIGVKNGVNLFGSKNLVGTFAPPHAVINDSTFLTTLDDRQWISGIAEAFKVAAIRDTDFLDWLRRHARDLRRRDMGAMEFLVRRCAELHYEHISCGGDPFERGSARPLDFGHWAAHKIEAMTAFSLPHGEAVSLGLTIDLLYATRMGYIGIAEARSVIGAMQQCGLPVRHPVLARRRGDRPVILDGLEEFRQHLGGILHVTYPSPLGKRLEVTHVDETIMSAVLDDLACDSDASRCRGVEAAEHSGDNP